MADGVVTDQEITDEELAALCRKLANLLEDESGRGMASWQLAVTLVGTQLYGALGYKLGKS